MSNLNSYTNFMKSLLNVVSKHLLFTHTSLENNALYTVSDMSFVISFHASSLEIIPQKDLTMAIGIPLKDIEIHNFTNNRLGGQDITFKDIKFEFDPRFVTLTQSKTHFIFMSYNFGTSVLSQFTPKKTTYKVTLDKFTDTYKLIDLPSYIDFPYKKYITASINSEYFL